MRPSNPRQEQPEEEKFGRALDARLVRRLWHFVRAYRVLFLLSCALLLAVSGAQLVQPYLIKVAIDDCIRESQWQELAGIAALFLAALAIEFVLRFAQLYVMERAGQNIVYDLRGAVFSHLQRLSASFYDRKPVGRIMTRVTSDVESLNEAFTSGAVIILTDLVKLAAIVAILLWMDWRLALVTFAVIPPMLAVSALFRVRLRRSYRAVRSTVARLNAFLQENVSGMRLTQLFGQERRCMREFQEINAHNRDAELTSVLFESAFSAVAELMASLTLAAIVWAGGWRILGDAVTFGTLVAFIEYAGKFFAPVQDLSERYTIMQSAMASAERIFELLDTKPTIVSPVVPRRVATAHRGEIAFDHVTFGYGDNRPVLHDVSFHIRPGEHVALVGWTGSGKSSVVRLLLRLYDVQQGRVLVDGVDVRDYDVRELRRGLGVVLQDHFMFTGTVASNISLGDPRIGPGRIREAAAAVQAARFIERRAAGYDEPVRERGSNFSVGERQLLAFARAIAFDPAVMVLDEATSSVDPATESVIQSALRTLLQGRTSLVIAHRLSTVQDADRVLVLHRGRLCEEGTPAELLRLEGGIYRTLFELQRT
ncbi:MAG: ABC transporter ATP-binding protein [Planctomycetota bacterium]